MSDWDWTPYVVGGGARPDAISGMNEAFSGGLAQLFASAPPEIQRQLRVSSGYRSPERQEQLWQEALAKYGSPEAARKWVAPPGRSQHGHGNAADLKFLSPAAQEWVHASAGNFGLAFPLSHEPWHVELATARNGGAGHPAHGGNSQNALAGPAMAPQGQQAGQQQPEQWRPTANLLDPAAFQSQRNALALVPVTAERQNILTRYL